MRCPFHPDGDPSAGINPEEKRFSCRAECGTIQWNPFWQRMRMLDKEAPEEEVVDFNPFDDATIIDLETRRRSREEAEVINEGKVRGYHDALMSMPDRLAWLVTERGINRDTMRKFKIGWDRNADDGKGRYTLPVYDPNGALVNIRRYRNDGDPKLRNARGHGSPPRLYPAENLTEPTLLICEGEWDALVATQNGIPAVTGTHGAKTWFKEWADYFEGKDVFVCYDADEEGIAGARKVALSVRRTAASVRHASLPGAEGYDVTDWFQEGKTAEELLALLISGSLIEDPQTKAMEEVAGTALPISVGEMGNAALCGKPLVLEVSVVGRRDPPYAVPGRIHAECDMSSGPHCELCPMNMKNGDATYDIDQKDSTTILRFIDVPEEKKESLIKRYIGIPNKCKVVDFEVASMPVEELIVMQPVESSTHVDYNNHQWHVYRANGHDTRTNTTARITGTTQPHPKSGQVQFLAWDLEETIANIDKFEMTPERLESLKVFQPAEGETPLDKCREIAEDMSRNVTHIAGRERLHMAMDLVWHSILQFTFGGKQLTRGWLEFVVVGDTRTGKSETAERLINHYGLGHFIGSENTSLAGLVGGVKQVGKAWFTQWGQITLNDRRLVVLDEVSGLSKEIIGKLSDIRSRGRAQVTKIETISTSARCRMIWISNPRDDGTGGSPHDGIMIIPNVIGQPEDIARFDFAMSVKVGDVSIDRIHSINYDYHEPTYDREACRDLILWAWSRKPDQVVWKPEATEAVHRSSRWLGKEYVDNVPLIQSTNIHEKIARMAVAMAARTFSTNDSGELVVVTAEHVKSATKFLHELYSYENFGYHRMSERVRKQRLIAKRSHKACKEWLSQHPKLLRFLVNRNESFRAQDLEEMAGLDKSEVSAYLSKLTEWHMIYKAKAQTHLSSELHAILRELEREQ